jgi:uncharacterized protein YjbJ (UPF0337 family)
MEETNMNWEIAKENWNLLKGNVKARWDHLAQNNLQVVGGKHGPLTVNKQKNAGATMQAVEEKSTKFVRPRKDHGPRI